MCAGLSATDTFFGKVLSRGLLQPGKIGAPLTDLHKIVVHRGLQEAKGGVPSYDESVQEQLPVMAVSVSMR